MINEDTMFRLMRRIHILLEVYEEAGEMDIDERISLKRALGVAADMWFNTDSEFNKKGEDDGTTN